MQTERTDTLVREVQIDARPETIFPLLTDASRITTWFGSAAELDPVPDGVFRVEIAEGIVGSGRFVEIEPPRRVVFTFGWEGGHPVAPGSTTVEITLTPDGDGTILRLEHQRLPVSEHEIHAHGWERYLGRIAIVASGGDPGPDAIDDPATG